MNHPVSMLLLACVTAAPDQAAAAANLAELILDSCAFDVVQLHHGPRRAKDKSAGDGPAWWLQALALEAGNKLEAAEEHIRNSCPHLGFAYATADMYRLRMLRLKQAGDTQGALEAFKKADSFIQFYSSLATSGGEGAALSAERDRFRAQLVASYGSDPEE